jgi:hypothetical protein
MTSLNLFQISSCNFFFTIRWYGDAHWGHRHLGRHRHAFDVWRISFVFEKYYGFTNGS